MLDDTIPVRSLTECSVCSNGELETIIDMPQLPLTGIYVSKRVPDMLNGHDQKLQFCPVCGHEQLEHLLEAEQLLFVVLVVELGRGVVRELDDLEPSPVGRSAVPRRRVLLPRGLIR